MTVTPDGALNLRDTEEIQQKLVEFLNRNQFDVDIEKLLDAPVIRASAGTCQMLIMNVSLDGWQRDLIRGGAPTTDRVLYIFRGEVYAHQPVWLTATVGIWSRQLQRLGLLRNVPPVIAIIAPRFCNAERLPWTSML